MNAWLPVLGWLAPVFLGLGLVALVAAFTLPGHGVPESLAALFLALFFVCQWFAGMTVLWGVACFVLGVGLMALEVFLLPGHGVLLAGGGLCALAGLILAFLPQKPFPELLRDRAFLVSAAARLSVSMVLAMAGSMALARFLPKSPYFRRISLETVADGTAVPSAEPGLVGRTGKVTSPLKPSGKAEFEGKILEVTSDEGFLESGRSVRIVSVQGASILVRSA